MSDHGSIGRDSAFWGTLIWGCGKKGWRWQRLQASVKFCQPWGLSLGTCTGLDLLPPIEIAIYRDYHLSRLSSIEITTYRHCHSSRLPFMWIVANGDLGIPSTGYRTLAGICKVLEKSNKLTQGMEAM